MSYNQVTERTQIWKKSVGKEKSNLNNCESHLFSTLLVTIKDISQRLQKCNWI